MDMKKSLTILIVAFTLGLLGQTNTQKVLTLEYQHGINLDSIDEPGKFFNIRQLCTNTIDSVLRTANVGFKHSKIGKIKDCFYQYQIRQDTIRTILIRTNKTKSTDQTINQTDLQFGVPIKTIDNENVSYTWSKLTKNKNMIAKMTTTQARKKSTLTIIIQ